jgi:hypothetical protein
VRVLLAFDRVARRAASLQEGLRDELMLAWIVPEDRLRVTASLYAEQASYLPGGRHFKGGLFPWEQRVLESGMFPHKGRVLLGAAGGGRELMALLERGFEVVAFDPCERFAEAARQASASHAGASVFHASYADLVDAAAGRGGPLSLAVRSQGFDAVVLGWGSLSHVTFPADRLSLLRALRAIAPRAPVLASFGLRPVALESPQSKGRVRNTLRRFFAAMGAPGSSGPGDLFDPDAGFLTMFAADEITSLAWEAGYEVALWEEGSYPHAVLVPLAIAGDLGTA